MNNKVECCKCHDMVNEADATRNGDKWICDVCENEDDDSYQDYHYIGGELVD